MGLLQKQNDALRKKVKKSELENQWRAFKETRNRQRQNLALFGDFEKIKDRVRKIRSESVGNWDLLKKAISRMEKNQFKVIQAKDAHEAREIFLKEIGEERIVVKSKSNLTKEIGLTHFLIDHGIEVIETDIGPDHPDCRTTGFSLYRPCLPSFAKRYCGYSLHLSEARAPPCSG